MKNALKLVMYHYCSRKCQKRDWIKRHRLICGMTTEEIANSPYSDIDFVYYDPKLCVSAVKMKNLV